MPFTVPPPPCDLAEQLPELLPHARTTTLLYPRAGSPGRRVSSLGGPLLWPAGEPWPTCAAPDHYLPGAGNEAVGPEPVAMVPILQLLAADVPALEFPAGADVLQVLWCALIHPEDDWGPHPELRWRSVAEVEAGPLLERAPQPYASDDEYLPRPCVVNPTQVTEYPCWDLPDELAERVEEWSEDLEEATGLDYWDAFTTTQSKIGGYPGWHQMPRYPDCACGERMEHLLTVSASGPGSRWWPLEEADLPRVESHGMVMGDVGGVYVFVCRSCPGWPTAHRYDC